jgi:hypothetical protein
VLSLLINNELFPEHETSFETPNLYLFALKESLVLLPQSCCPFSMSPLDKKLVPEDSSSLSQEMVKNKSIKKKNDFVNVFVISFTFKVNNIFNIILHLILLIKDKK